jgi:ABC-2 type transport system ATP-binding protein
MTRMPRQPDGTAGGVDPVAVSVTSLHVRRGRRDVLADLTLTVERGRVTGLLGPSGSGKTTLMRAIVGVQVVQSGDVRVLGRPAGSPDLRRTVGYVTQAPSVYGDLTTRANVTYFARLAGVPAPRAAAQAAIERVDLSSRAEARVRDLSGGERSRVSLASALVGDPEVLVLDEPTVGLDPVLRRDLWAMFHELADSGTTLLVSSHVMDEATRCDRLLLLRHGRLVADETPASLLERTGQPDAERAFLHLLEQQGPP